MSKLKDYLSTLNISMGQTIRGNCPVCNRHNTFTCTRDLKGIMYNCFSADCKVAGYHQIKMDAKDLRSACFRAYAKDFTEATAKLFVFPDYIKRVDDSMGNVIMYMENTGIMPYFKSDSYNILYDPKEDRVVFRIKSGYRHVDAVGRALSGAYPKWKRYGNSNIPFFAYSQKSTKAIIVVEDCASAANISTDFHSVALMGTNLSHNHIHEIIANNPNGIAVVALDKDATKKAIEIRKDLSALITTKTVMLDKDIKDMDTLERQAFIDKVNSMV